VRAIIEATFWPKAFTANFSVYEYYLISLLPGIFIDVLPLVGVMWLHHKTFRTKVIP